MNPAKMAAKINAPTIKNTIAARRTREIGTRLRGGGDGAARRGATGVTVGATGVPGGGSGGATVGGTIVCGVLGSSKSSMLIGATASLRLPSVDGDPAAAGRIEHHGSRTKRNAHGPFECPPYRGAFDVLGVQLPSCPHHRVHGSVAISLDGRANLEFRAREIK